MIHVAQDAAEWYKKELELTEGQAVRFFPRYSAGGHVHPGFSLGIDTAEPKKPGLSATVGGILFYMEDQDLWYLDGYDLKVSYDAEADDIVYEYVQ
ncbi:HesB/YadR/YfhF family protein [Paenibacillus pinistramenti]|uniref:HesB/YadR/YfhF family protein n=1 Tax=Paenibacillus pinistramenti TaxID=1768003 RepID=UPI001109AC27|nr:hypothetical protein [Paenibacillus pinistramenti]